MVTLRAVIYYSERIQSQISKREKACEKSRGNQVPFPSLAVSCAAHVKSSQGSSLETEGPGFLAEAGRVGRHPLPATYQNPRLSQGKEAFSINHILCANRLDTVSLHIGK